MADFWFSTGIEHDEEAPEQLNYQMYKMSLKHVIQKSKFLSYGIFLFILVDISGLVAPLESSLREHLG